MTKQLYKSTLIMRQSLHLEHDSVQILQNMRFTPIWVTKTSRYSYPYTMSEFQTDITLRVVSISNQNLDIVFECSFCLYLQIIITFCLKKRDI